MIKRFTRRICNLCCYNYTSTIFKCFQVQWFFYLQGKNIISSTLSPSVLLFYKSIIYKSLNKPLSFRSIYNPKPILINHHVSLHTHTRSGTTTYPETTTLAPMNSYYVTQSDFSTTIKHLLTNFDDNFKEFLKETIAYQDAKYDKKL